MKNSIKERLQDIFRERVSFGVPDRLSYSFDATNVSFLPDCVAFPVDREEVALTIELAVEESLGVVPRCAGSGFSGGTAAIKGGLVLSFEKMNRLLEIDRDALVARVEPGVVTARLQKEVEKLGLFYPPDPASLSFSMIGGNIGTNAGGPRGLKYGTTRDYVTGLDVVAPAFGVIRTEERNGGFDLTPLFVGSEGTLGAIVEARLRLVRVPDETATILACFDDMRSAALALDFIIGEGIVPSTAEFIDKPTMECAFRDSEVDRDIVSSNVLILEVDGAEGEVEENSERVTEAFRGRGAKVRFARDEEERTRIWSIRRAISPSLALIAPNKLNPDVCVPRSKLPDYLYFVGTLARKYSLRIFNFGHAGDGNIHTNIMFDASNVSETEAARSALSELFEKTLELGGTLSGEHGIGMARSGVLPMQVGANELDLRMKYKKVFDPAGIMNPGKAV